MRLECLPFDCAVSRNLLLEHRAEPEQPNGRGDVPRYLALANGHKHVHLGSNLMSSLDRF